jgi:hypothetical protein
MRYRRILNKIGLAGSGLTRGLLCFAVLSVSTMLAADVSGIWTGQTVDRNGDLQDLSFRFTWNGSTLTGKMYGDNESTLIGDASISGNQIAFLVTTELNGGITKFRYTGTVTGDEMELVRKRVDLKVDLKADTAVKDAAVKDTVVKDPAAKEEAAKAAQPQHLRLKRIA